MNASSDLVSHLLSFYEIDYNSTYFKKYKNQVLFVSSEWYQKTFENSINIEKLFILFCANGYAKEIQYMLKNKYVDPTINQNEALITACINGHLNVVKILCESGRLNPSHKWNSPIIAACEYGHLDIVRYLIEEQKVNITDQNNKAFRWGVLNSKYDVVKYLLNNPDVDPTDGRCEVIEKIMEKGDWNMYYILMNDNRINEWCRENNPELLRVFENGHYQ